jgi:PAS domain S-box-containing protein
MIGRATIPDWMRDPEGFPARYGSTLLAVLLAAFLRELLQPLLGPRYPYATFYLAVVWAAWSGGWGPALLALGLAVVAVHSLFTPPFRALSVPNPTEWSGIALFIFTGAASAALGVAERQARQAAEASAREARARQRELEEEVDERRRAEAGIAELAARMENQRLKLESIVESVPGIVWEAWGQPDGSTQRIDFVSDYVETMLGYSVQEWISTPNFWLTLVHPDDRERAAREAAAIFAGGQGGSSHFRWIARDGRVVWGLAHSVVVRDAEGRPAGMRGVVIDITAQKRAEQALQEADRRKDEFLAMLAHELRNPLAPIGNAAEFLKRHAGADPLLAQQAERIERQLRHMARLLDDLLDVSRITQDRIELRREPTDLATVLTLAIDACRPAIERHGHVLSISLPDEPVPLYADVTRLVQVVDNLLQNAVKYTDPGGRIEVQATREREEAVVRVSDNGIGIAAEMLPHVFDLFMQAERGLDRSQGGLGIGLTMVERLVTMHGGSVSVHSDGPGRGSEFTVRLPVEGVLRAACWVRGEDSDRSASERPANTLTQHAARSTQHASEASRRVLIVDDNRDAAQSLADLLEISGYEVRVEHDGPAALAAAREELPEAVLLDIGLPGMDGYEVARRLREAARGRPLLLVALTGYGQEGDRQRARDAGFDHHLVKPVTFETVEALLSEVSLNPPEESPQ